MTTRRILTATAVVLPLFLCGCQRPAATESPGTDGARQVVVPAPLPATTLPAKPVVVPPPPTDTPEADAATAIEQARGEVHWDAVTGKTVVAVRLTGVSATDATLKQLKALPHLQALTIRSRAFANAGLGEIKGLKGMQVLDLYATSVTDAGLKDLKDLTDLKELDLSDTTVTDAGLAELKDLPNLESLGLAGCEGITDGGVRELKEFKHLKKLQIAGSRVTAAGMRDLKKALPGLDFD
jgi:hypothetical protein